VGQTVIHPRWLSLDSVRIGDPNTRIMGLRAWVPPRIRRGIRRAIEPLKYRLMLRFQPRKNRVYTQFFRFPHQYLALVERIVPDLLARDPTLRERGLDVAVFACCSGEEVYTLKGELAQAFPELEVRVRGYDIVPEVIEQARVGEYSEAQVRAGPFVTERFLDGSFDRDGETFRVKPSLRTSTSFAVGDMTSSDFMSSLPRFDLVYAQNVLFHLPRPVAASAFKHLVGLMAANSALFINGMDTDMRIALTKAHDLDPLDYLVEEIHEDARVDRGAKWANQYWGREPFSKASTDWLRKFGTIYVTRA
jgi:chemotaxis protein methyltransferase CheR